MDVTTTARTDLLPASMPGPVVLLLAVLAGAPFVAALAGWLPSFMAAQQDPAEILSQE